MKQIALFLIKCYKFISRFLPSICRFQPSCSTYAYQAVETYGFFKGFLLTFKRIIRCRPFCAGGFDPVPLPKKKI
ncbi:MAG: membrane protein insertion efficiency factor YidD [Candidatus Endomicrobiellum trichonymphae]|uniref:membrane protein insertion efficiency factor YidD n=1 Tax=Endomicrobium trichonymphae TaxID=1408204 RepID=UPI0027D3D49F|nr:MAG: membrane protein insertion efficiency factor YidD [Candidatus Endomicrobium trichonymphae]